MTSKKKLAQNQGRTTGQEVFQGSVVGGGGGGGGDDDDDDDHYTTTTSKENDYYSTGRVQMCEVFCQPS